MTFKRMYSGIEQEACIVENANGTYTVITPVHMEQCRKDYKTMRGAVNWLVKCGWKEVEEATEEELVEDTMEPTLEQKLDEMAVAAVVTNKQVKQLREKYESILANADTDEECGRDDMAEYRRNYAQGMYQACKMMGIEL